MDLLNLIVEGLAEALSWILHVLPDSPFLAMEEIESPWFQTICWFFPVSAALTHLSAFVGAVGMWYGIRIIARWVKVAGS